MSARFSALFRHVLVACAAFACVAAPPQIAAQPITINFENIPTNSAGLNNTFTGTAGFTFFNWNVATTTSLGSGTNAQSGTKFALGRENLSSIFRTDGLNFTVFSAWLSFRQFDLTDPDNSPVRITVNGYRAGDVTPTFTQFLMLTNTAQLFTFGWTNLDEFSFETDDLSTPTRTVALAMDDLSVVVPEPAAVLLMGTGLVLLLCIRRGVKRH
jgi:hypothetical protein